MNIRTEKDLLGEQNVPADAYYGIHTQRAVGNFSLTGRPVYLILIESLAQVKLACLRANKELGCLSDDVARLIEDAIDEIISGKFNDSFPVDAFQGGAGTSFNMNMNEVIANRALELMGNDKGTYNIIHPNDHVNLHQSTNDVFSTAVKVAVIKLCREASACIEKLQFAFQKKEKEFASIVTMGRTEMQEAVPMTMGMIFSGFSEAFARDRWRMFKSEERLRVVNLGGTAVGTGMCAPRSYIFLVVEKLREVTGFGLARAENAVDQTSNVDVFVEVSGMIKAFGVNLLKVCNDLRDLHSRKELVLPKVQAGSSIMPGKVNPVILEAAIQVGMKIIANDSLVSMCSSSGSAQINEFLPLLADALIESFLLMKRACVMLAEHISGIGVDIDVCGKMLKMSDGILTAFVPVVGYAKATELFNEYSNSSFESVMDFVVDKFGADEVEKILSAGNVSSLGFK